MELLQRIRRARRPSDLLRRPQAVVLFVCTANVCRSPMAQWLMTAELRRRGWQRRLHVASAGTHVGQPGRGADPRAREVLLANGIAMGRSRARQLVAEDFARYDFLLAMDNSHLHWLRERCPEELQQKISPLASWGGEVAEIPDPYFGSASGFAQVFSLLQAPIDQFLAQFEPAPVEEG